MFRFQNAPVWITQHKLHRAADMVHPGFVRHFALYALARNAITLPVLDKLGSGFDETERYIVRTALFGEGFYPVEITGTRAIVIFTSGNNLFDLSRHEVFLDFDTADQGGGHNALVFERQFQQERNTLVGSLLILARHIEKYILPAIAPIRRQGFPYTFGTFGQKKKFHIAPGFDNTPCLLAPRIRVLQKEIRRHAHPYQFAATNLVSSVPAFLQRIGKSALRAENTASVHAAFTVEKIHVTMPATFAYFRTAVPGIPYIVHIRLFKYIGYYLVHILTERDERAHGSLLLGVVPIDAHQRDVIRLRCHPLEREADDGRSIVANA